MEIKGRNYDLIVAAEANRDKAKTTYDKDRKYVENVQEPSSVPDGEQYIKEDKITDLHRRLIGGMIAGEIDIKIIGGGEKKKPLRELFAKILAWNMFKEKIVEQNMNYFYCEGLAWIKYDYNPYKKSPFGIGAPIIQAYRPGEIMFDPESIDPMHYEDNCCILKVRKTLKYVQERWPEKKDEVVASTDEEYGGLQAPEELSLSRYVDLYEIVKKETVLTTAMQDGEPLLVDGKTIKIEEDVYYVEYVANKTIDLERKKTEADDFHFISMIHTPRVDTDNEYGRYPFGTVRLLGGSQDVLNIITSMMVRVVKKDIKNLAIISGATPEEVLDYKEQASSEHGVVVLNSPEARVTYAPKTGLAPSMVQLRNIIAFTFDSQTGKYSPDRGEQSGSGMSGVAIGKLQNRGTLPEFVAKNHIEVAYTRLARLILKSIKEELSEKPFKISTQVQGEEVDIYYNFDIEDVVGDIDTDYNVRAEGPDGYSNIINDLSDLDEVDVVIRVDMSVEERRNYELQKAFTLAQIGKLSTEDLLKTAYPDTYQDRLQNLRKENKAFELMGRISNMDPNMLGQVDQLTTQIESLIPGLMKMSGSAANKKPDEVIPGT